MKRTPAAERIAAETRTLALLREVSEQVRTELVTMRRDLAQAQQQFGDSQAAQLLEANEQLLLAALESDRVAQSALTRLSELSQASLLDHLTGTPGRELMVDRLAGAIAKAHRDRSRLALVFVDIDHFKAINDGFGHAVGDAVLRAAARRLESVVRESDTVSRHGGDEFLVLLTDTGTATDVARVAAAMVEALEAPLSCDGHAVALSASLGIAIYPDDGTDAALLIERADVAMYRSKHFGGGRYQLHRSEPAAAGDPAPRAAASPRVGPRGAPPLPSAAGRLGDLQQANERLVLAALSAHEQVEQSQGAHSRRLALLAVVAHELRNPLAPMRAAATLLGRSGADRSVVERVGVIIERQVGHMARLVDDLLDGSRSGQGKFRLERSVVDLGEALALALETCRTAIESRRQRVDLELPAAPVRVDADPVRLAQIFSNLLDNASKYTAELGRITIRLERRGATAVVVVADNGAGIAADSLPQVFDLFVQDTRALPRPNSGLGIGLAVVRELVEAHGGHVTASSEGLGHGSEFVVTLPIAPALAPLA